jgi:hypothetical protein
LYVFFSPDFGFPPFPLLFFSVAKFEPLVALFF